MAHYDPNDPRRTETTDPHRPVDPNDRATVVTETYVEPVEKKASPLPLIIGILLALALAWWLLSTFMGKDDVAVTEPAGTTTTTTGDTVVVAPADTTTAPEADTTADVPAVETTAPAATDTATETAPAATDTTPDTAATGTENVTTTTVPVTEGTTDTPAADATTQPPAADATAPATDTTTTPSN